MNTEQFVCFSPVIMALSKTECRWYVVFHDPSSPATTKKFAVRFESQTSLFCFLVRQGLEVIESTNLKYFTKEMTAEFYALKGMFLAQINKYVRLELRQLIE